MNSQRKTVMRDIKGHNSLNAKEVYALFDAGGYTMCTLPHYRYAMEKKICGELMRCGLIKESGRTGSSVNLVPLPAYHAWRADVKNGKATDSIKKLKRIIHPPKLRKKKCITCGIEFETINNGQKRCKKLCRVKLAKGNTHD